MQGLSGPQTGRTWFLENQRRSPLGWGLDPGGLRRERVGPLGVINPAHLPFAVRPWPVPKTPSTLASLPASQIVPGRRTEVPLSRRHA